MAMINSLRYIVQKAVEMQASDLHIIVDAPPVVRVNGEILLLQFDKLSAQDSKDMVISLLNDLQIKQLQAKRHLCFTQSIENLGYFRIAIYFSRGNIEASIRIAPLHIKKLNELGLPSIIEELTRKSFGIMLITGPTGVGKTTTLNAIIDFINHERRCKIVTIEDPIEYMHHHYKSIIIQQEVYADTPSFAEALFHVLRQNPDIICIGELRDMETISTALTAAETGHLIIATLHTPDAAITINRIIDVFSPEQQNQTRLQLAATLQAVISQKLLPRIDKKGRVLACEVLLATEAVRNLIRENKIQQMDNIIMTSAQYQMLSMDKSIKELYQKGLISYDTAMSHLKDQRTLTKPVIQGIPEF
jgi:twitching motility protein PilT